MEQQTNQQQTSSCDLMNNEAEDERIGFWCFKFKIHQIGNKTCVVLYRLSAAILFILSICIL